MPVDVQGNNELRVASLVVNESKARNVIYFGTNAIQRYPKIVRSRPSELLYRDPRTTTIVW